MLPMVICENLDLKLYQVSKTLNMK